MHGSFGKEGGNKETINHTYYHALIMKLYAGCGLGARSLVAQLPPRLPLRSPSVYLQSFVVCGSLHTAYYLI